jgi:histidine phosphotransferase ChpT
MSEALVQNDDETPDALALSALLSSRVCHDLINPVGAIGSGLDVLDDPEMDETMRSAALDLVRSGAKKALALLSYARLAYGAAGGFGAMISMDDAREAMKSVYENIKPDLVWELDGGLAAKENVKALLILVNAAADFVARGGTVTVKGDVNAFKITAIGKRIYKQEDLVRALSGDARDISPKFTPALIAGQLIKSVGGAVSAIADEEKAVITARFSESNTAE